MTKNKKNPSPTKNKELLNQIRQLEVMLEFTKRGIDGKSTDLDRLFTNQAKRIQEQIDKLQGN